MENEIKVLLADQDQVFLELVKIYLKKIGARIIACNSGEEALSAIRHEKPGIVFMSAALHGLSGLKCCETVKNDPLLEMIPIVLTLTSGSMEQLEACNQAGCDEILRKPVDRHTFFSTVKKYVDLDKRNAPRFKGKLDVRFTLPDGSAVASGAYDISTGGLFLEISNPLPVSSVISVNFVLPASDTEIECAARVAWTNNPDSPAKPAFPSGMGISFVDLPQEWVTAIMDFLHDRNIAPMFKD